MPEVAAPVRAVADVLLETLVAFGVRHGSTGRVPGDRRPRLHEPAHRPVRRQAGSGPGRRVRRIRRHQARRPTGRLRRLGRARTRRRLRIRPDHAERPGSVGRQRLRTCAAGRDHPPAPCATSTPVAWTPPWTNLPMSPRRRPRCCCWRSPMATRRCGRWIQDRCRRCGRSISTSASPWPRSTTGCRPETH